MTRINLVPVAELCDQHLLAEHRELVRIPNGLAGSKLQFEYHDRPSEYVLGAGHVKFFTDKLRFLYYRYQALYEECVARGFNVTYMWPDDIVHKATLRYWNDYTPSKGALRLNRARIAERMPARARWTPSY